MLTAELHSTLGSVRAASILALSRREWSQARPVLLEALFDADGWAQCFALREVLRHEPDLISGDELLRVAFHNQAVQVRVTAIANLENKKVPRRDGNTSPAMSKMTSLRRRSPPSGHAATKYDDRFLRRLSKPRHLDVES